MSEFNRFGTPALFEISTRWTEDEEPYDRLPQASGWSMGDMQITVGHQVLTARRFENTETNYISWYVHPFLDWLISQWTWIFHEEVYSWPDKSGAPAAIALAAALGRTIGSLDEAERTEYSAIQSWWKRHALRAADSSAVYPDIYFRRVADDLEVSWTALQPAYPPEGMSLALSPGRAILPITAVAHSLWECLNWCLKTAPVTVPADIRIVAEMKKRLGWLKATPLRELESKYLHGRLQELLSSAAVAVSWSFDSTLIAGIPVAASLDAAVLMYGGLSPAITKRDAVRVLKFLKKHRSQTESTVLLRLVDNRSLNLAVAPYEDGYELAEDAREDLHIGSAQSHVNIMKCLHDLGISVQEISMDTDSVRGIAIAGDNFSPAILINTTSTFNKTPQGRKFTMAHELCHILFDRTRARRISHVSGSWTNARVEKRANAFAAMFLASRSAVKRTFTEATNEAIKKQADDLDLGYSSLVEHLFNLGLIDEAARERLRAPS